MYSSVLTREREEEKARHVGNMFAMLSPIREPFTRPKILNPGTFYQSNKLRTGICREHLFLVIFHKDVTEERCLCQWKRTSMKQGKISEGDCGYMCLSSTISHLKLQLYQFQKLRSASRHFAKISWRQELVKEMGLSTVLTCTRKRKFLSFSSFLPCIAVKIYRNDATETRR